MDPYSELSAYSLVRDRWGVLPGYITGWDLVDDNTLQFYTKGGFVGRVRIRDIKEYYR